MQSDVLIVDNIGMLSSLYKYGNIAYIGGGFGIGIHNILEAAVYGMPVIFGPVYKKFIEAVELIKAGGAFSVSGYNQFAEVLKQFVEHPTQRIKPSEITRHFVESNKGGTLKIIEFIKSKNYITI